VVCVLEEKENLTSWCHHYDVTVAWRLCWVEWSRDRPRHVIGHVIIRLGTDDYLMEIKSVFPLFLEISANIMSSW